MKITDPYYIAAAHLYDRLNARRYRRDLAGRGNLAARIRARLAEQDEHDEPEMSDEQAARIAAVLRSA